MTGSPKSGRSQNDLAKWLVTALEGHVPSRQIRSRLGAEFGLTANEALTAERDARAGILHAIAGSKKNMPNAKTDPIGHAAFRLVWDSFNQNSFFDKRHTPSRKWLDWKAQQTYRQFD